MTGGPEMVFRRRPVPKSRLKRAFYAFKDAFSSVRSFADTVRASFTGPNKVLDELEKHPVPPEVVFGMYKKGPDRAAVFRLKKGE